MKAFRPILALALSLVPAMVFAQQAPRPQNGTPKSTFRTEFLNGVDEVEEKLTNLATATPADKFGWRPASDVRSIGEVYMHITGGNYFLATFAGVKAPADIPKDFERITDKQRILAELHRSFEHLRSAVAKVSDAEFEKSVKLFGSPTTHRGVYVTILNHNHEHLGQSIAYARMNGVTPPWSRQ